MAFSKSIGDRTASRRRNEEFLIGHFEDDIKGANLPSNRQAFGYFLHLTKEKGSRVDDAAATSVRKIAEFWERANIPIIRKDSCMRKMKKMYKKYRNLQKSHRRRTETQAEKEEAFKNCLDDLFDIACNDALSMITIEKDKKFLIAQREKRRDGSMIGADRVRRDRKQQKDERENNIKQRRLKRAKRASQDDDLATKINQSVSSSGEGEEEPVPGPSTQNRPSVKRRKKQLRGSVITAASEYHPENVPVTTHSEPGEDRKELCTFPIKEYASPKKRGQEHIITPGLALVLDRYKISDLAAHMVISETAKSLGHDVRSMALSRSSIRGQRQAHSHALKAGNQQQMAQPVQHYAVVSGTGEANVVEMYQGHTMTRCEFQNEMANRLGTIPVERRGDMRAKIERELDVMFSQKIGAEVEQVFDEGARGTVMERLLTMITD